MIFKSYAEWVLTVGYGLAIQHMDAVARENRRGPEYSSTPNTSPRLRVVESK